MAPEPKPKTAQPFALSQNWRKLKSQLAPPTPPKAAHATKAKRKSRSGSGSPAGRVGGAVAIDCEMVGVGVGGKRSALARVSLVNEHEDVLFDAYVMPTEKIRDYRTDKSGITADLLVGADPSSVVVPKVMGLIASRVVVGHGLVNDFETLGIVHPAHLTRDTALFRPFRNPRTPEVTPSLQGLVRHWLREDLEREDGHNSVDDARMVMRLYKLKKREWDRRFQSVDGGDSRTQGIKDEPVEDATFPGPKRTKTISTAANLAQLRRDVQLKVAKMEHQSAEEDKGERLDGAKLRLASNSRATEDAELSDSDSEDGGLMQTEAETAQEAERVAAMAKLLLED